MSAAPTTFTRIHRWPVRIGICIWLLLLLGSGVVLWHYSTAPGASGSAVTRLPDAESRGHSDGRLVMFLHPHCSCSRSSVRTLNIALQSVDADVAVDLYFYTPDETADNWHHTALWKLAEAIPGVRCRVDVDGQAARRFGVATSGHVLLFGPDGRRQYSGGITSGRGHEGANDGINSLVTLLRGHQATTCTFPVYGCGILNTSSLETGTL